MIDLALLTRFQRMLLGTDGTVTHILAVYAGEPIDVVKLVQEYASLTDADSPLNLDDETMLLRRKVILRGRCSGAALLYAEAGVVPERVEPSFLEGLLNTDKPIGVLLAENRTETYREILVTGRERAGPCAVHFGIDPSDMVVYRSYRIFAGGQPIVLITEKFPQHFFQGVGS